MQSNQNYRGQSYRCGYWGNYRNDNYKGDRSRSKDRQNSDNSRRGDRSSNRSRSGSGASNNRDRIRCYTCREYDNFAKDYPTLKVEKESEEIQQIYNMHEEQTALRLLARYLW